MSQGTRNRKTQIEAPSTLESGDSLPLSVRLGGAASGKRLTGSTLRPLAHVLWLLVLSGAACITAHGQSYSIDWSTVDGGGGTSTGGVYQVSGTIGQPDAGTMGGGIYALSGGFWGVVAAVQTEGAPYLSVVRSNGTVVVSWPLAVGGWLLHATTNFVTGGSVWTEVPPPYQTNGVNLQFTEGVPLSGKKFYRLHRP
jgi:hypothetical protein